MVYHEIRSVNGKKQNYLISNQRKGNKWVKKSKFIGTGMIAREKIDEFKNEFEIEIKVNKKCLFLKKEQVEEIEKLRQIYIENIKKLSAEEFEKFERSFFTELTYNSNAIEGNSLSLQETSLVINENIAPQGKTVREIYEAKNHSKALELLKAQKGDISEEFLLKIHSIILENISQRFAGRYRENPVRVIGSNVKFPQPELIEQLIKNLFYWYEQNRKKMHPFELAVVFSAKLVSIHPFVDGNGRVSRIAMNFILKKNKYPWINIYMKQRADYLNAVRKANDEDYSELLDFLIKSLRENLGDFGFLK